MTTARRTRFKRVEDSAHAPIVSVDSVPAFGSQNGYIHLTVAANRFLPDGEEIAITPVVTAYLRLSREVAQVLRDSIDNALLMSTPQKGSPN